MATTYREADLGTHQRIENLRDASFPDLREAVVTVTAMFVHNPDGPAVKHHGCPAKAKIKINSLADRAEGKRHVTITIDAEVWDGLNERQQEALLFHELTHLVVARDDGSGAIKRDDLGCPRLKCEPDSYTINGFFECAQRYGTDSPEYDTLMKIVGEYRQRGLFDDWDQPARSSGNGRRRSAASH